MSALKASLVAAFAVTLCSSAAWAAKFPAPHAADQSGCPTAVEKLAPMGQATAQTSPANPDDKSGKAADKKTLGDAGPPAIGQHGLLLPAVKQGKAAGPVGAGAAKAEAAGAK